LPKVTLMEKINKLLGDPAMECCRHSVGK
jgi:hypothetical protein